MENTNYKSIGDAFAEAEAAAAANPLQSFGDYMLSVANEHYMKDGRVIEGFDLIDGVIKERIYSDAEIKVIKEIHKLHENDRTLAYEMISFYKQSIQIIKK
tara:strand:- start:274 stop:576 length:303 start_codon:yes stop_codon:yes gene_type:complete